MADDKEDLSWAEFGCLKISRLYEYLILFILTQRSHLEKIYFWYHSDFIRPNPYYKFIL